VAEQTSDCSCWKSSIPSVPAQGFGYFEDPSCRGGFSGLACLQKEKMRSFRDCPLSKYNSQNQEALCTLKHQAERDAQQSVAESSSVEGDNRNSLRGVHF